MIARKVNRRGSSALGQRARNPWPALTLLAGALMLVPSALSIAFPYENPSVVRTGGALPALMVVCAAGPAAMLTVMGPRAVATVDPGGRARVVEGSLCEGRAFMVFETAP